MARINIINISAASINQLKFAETIGLIDGFIFLINNKYQTKISGWYDDEIKMILL